MKVLIGTTIFDGAKQPVMVILSDEDKKNIANMLPEATRYCSYPDTMTIEEAESFMKVEKENG